MTTVEERRAPRTYGNWRRPTSAGLFGLGTLGTYGLMGGLVVVVLTVMLTDLVTAAVVFGVVVALSATIVLRDVHGKNALSRIVARVGWWRTRSAGAHLYRSGPLGRTPWGSYQLPGILAPTRLTEHTDSYGRPFALLHTPSVGTYSVVVGAEPDGASLVDREQIDHWVADWGHWLAHLGNEVSVEAAAVTIETSPDSGSRLRQEVESNMHDDAPEFARTMLREAAATYPLGSSTVKAFVSVTFAAAARAGARRRGPEEMGRELASRLPGLTASLQEAGAGATRPLSAREVCETVRIAYDPAAAPLIDEAHAVGRVPEFAWTDVGPSATETSWSSYRHDSGISTTWAMTSAPSGVVQSGVLARLLAPHHDIARKRVTLLYRPIDAARAAAMVEADLRAAEFRQTASTKPAARDTAAVRAAASTAAEEASGAGLVNFGMLITATVLDGGKEADARAAVDTLAAVSRLRVRPVYGAQDSAFAAALPLGLVLSKHLALPTEVRERI